MPTLNKPKKAINISVNRKERQKIYQSTLWKKLRIAKLLQNPLCEKCLESNIIVPAIDIHHKDSFMNYTGLKRLEKAYDFNNLMSLCKDCHTKIHNFQHS